MPIYAYKCDSCGFAKDVLQKISDAPLHDCPSCGKDSFKKQLTAAGFQLKGSGWYVTDFKGSGSTSAPPVGGDKGSKATEAAPAATPAAESSSPSPAAPAAPAKSE